MTDAVSSHAMPVPVRVNNCPSVPPVAKERGQQLSPATVQYRDIGEVSCTNNGDWRNELFSAKCADVVNVVNYRTITKVEASFHCEGVATNPVEFLYIKQDCVCAAA